MFLFFGNTVIPSFDQQPTVRQQLAGDDEPGGGNLASGMANEMFRLQKSRGSDLVAVAGECVSWKRHRTSKTWGCAEA